MLPVATSISETRVLVAILFWIFAAVSAASALGVVMSRNIVRTAVALLFTLLGIAGLYFLLNAEFLAAVQLVVFAGGTLILIIFGVMLTSKSPFSRFQPKRWEVVIGTLLATTVFATIVAGISRTTFRQTVIDDSRYPIVRLGQLLMGDYLVPFELVSVVLLVVMIGAAYLAKSRRGSGTRSTGENLSAVMRKWS